MSDTARDQVVVFYADDDPDDRLLLQDAWEAGGIPHPLRLSAGGAAVLEAITDHLSDPGQRAAAVVLVDLKMPGIGGDEVLRRLKGDPTTSHVPVSILSSSDDPHDLRRIYASGGASYLVKPSTFDDLIRQVQAFSTYWANTVLLAGRTP